MPPVVGDSSSASDSIRTATIAEHIRLRRPRNEITQPIIPESDPSNPSSSSRSKSTTKKKLNNFRGFGCTAAASQQVSLPAVIRTSADWDGKKVKKKKHQKKNSNSSTSNSYSNNKSNGVGDGCNGNNNNNSGSNYNTGNCMVIQDVWCGPGIGLSADAVVGSVDCVVARRNGNVSGRGKIDGEKVNQRERDRDRERERERERERDRDRDRERSCLSRRTVNTEGYPFPESDSVFALPRPELDIFGSRYCRHVRHPSPDDLAEIMLLQNSFMLGGRVDSHDHFRDWRLDVDNMTYEELLELGERIGHVSTGLKEDEIGRCIRRIKNSIINDFSSHLPVIVDKKCTICQEEYEADDEMGRLECGHSFHIQCIKQWLSQKNTCPVCKTDVAAWC